MITIEQDTLLSIAGSHVKPYQPVAFEPVQNLWVAQDLVLDHLAALHRVRTRHVPKRPRIRRM